MNDDYSRLVDLWKKHMDTWASYEELRASAGDQPTGHERKELTTRWNALVSATEAVEEHMRQMRPPASD